GRLRTVEQLELNRLLLEGLYRPDILPATMVRRAIVVGADQLWRLAVLVTALGLFALACGLVNLNATSMHAYYRDRLRGAFVDEAGGRPLTLAELNTTRGGGPYPLISATLTNLPNLRQYLGSSPVDMNDRT